MSDKFRAYGSPTGSPKAGDDDEEYGGYKYSMAKSK